MGNVLRDGIPVILAFFTAMVLSRIYEWIVLAFYHGTELFGLSYVVFSLIHDLQITLVASIPLVLVYWILRKWLPAKRYSVIAIFITIPAIINGLLVTYFSATLIPLGPEFWAYSIKEMTDTVLATEGFTVWNVLLFSLAVAFLYIIVRKIAALSFGLQRGKKKLWGIVVAVSLLLATGFGHYLWKQSERSAYYTNKLDYFISQSIATTDIFAGGNRIQAVNRKYPFLHRASNRDVLGPYFQEFSSSPNIVFIIVESLGGEFVGKEGQWSGFAPYLDSLARKGLYWENGLSLSGRTFGVMPSLLGSLPPARHGFMEIGPNYPNHLTLISLLEKRGYHTSYYSGFDTYFDKLNYFLDYQGIDFLLNRQKIQSKNGAGKSGGDQNYWGYDDKTMFKVASSILDTVTSFPRLEIYHTLQSHSPFTVPRKGQYKKKFDSLLNEMVVSSEQKRRFRQYRSELTTLLYTDDALKDFMKAYQKRDYYENTIFVITGDHWLIPVPQTTQISRYHVPIIIYSPLLKRSVHFKSVNTHANIVPSLVSLLNKNTNLAMPGAVPWIGAPMDTSRSFRNNHSLPLMKNKNQLTDYIDGPFYLSGNKLFKLSNNLRLTVVDSPKVKTQLQGKLRQFKAKSEYAVAKNKIYPVVQGGMPMKYASIARFDTLFHRVDSTGMTVDEQFQLARTLAFNSRYAPARAIGVRLLLQNPGYHDVRLLVGRTYAWEGAYDKARKRFNRVIAEDPAYRDAYNALFDTEYWDGNYREALDVINRGLSYHAYNEQFLMKKVRVLVTLDRHLEARKVFRKLRNHHPESGELQEAQKYISD